MNNLKFCFNLKINYFEVTIILFFLMILVSCDNNGCRISITEVNPSPDSNYLVCRYFKDCGAIANGPIEISFLKKGEKVPEKSNFIENGDELSLENWNKNNEIVFHLNVPKPEFKIINSFNLKLKFIQEYGEKIDYYYSDYEITDSIIKFSPSFSQILKFGFEKFNINMANIEKIKFNNEYYFYRIKNPITKIDYFNYEGYRIKRVRNIFGSIIGKIPLSIK